MSRTRARALALVNWKGVFYERYLLHRHVTALEGSNGAGKTTVMIAAYVVLLPDMSRLRFTNLGETGATGGDKGIWGRLGEPGRPSYAALDLELPSSERLLAGVLLAKKAEPSVEPTPFIVTGLSPEARLQDLLLLRREGHDEVPELAELKSNASRLGAECQVFSSTRDYLNALFELGVTPLKLGNEEERRKFNEMLRTSMTGGISRALTSELRSFLLKEETGLGDALTHMKNNLEACRRTRIEVSEARRLDHEIAGIYAASQRMVTAALGAELARTRELARARSEALALALRAEQELAHANDAVVAAEARRAELLEELGTLGRALEAAEADRARRQRARTLGERLREIEGELGGLAQHRHAAQAERERAAAERAQRASERDRLRDDYERTTRGLAHVQTGLEELHRHAHAFRAANERLSLVRSLLGKPEFSPDDAALELEAARARKTELDRELVRLDRERELAFVERADHERAFAALRKLEPSATAEDAHGRARAALARFADLERLAGRELELAGALADAKGTGARQSAVRARAVALLGHDPAHDEEPIGSQTLCDELDRAERELGELREQAAELLRRQGQELVNQRTLDERGQELERAARELAAAKLVLGRITGAERAEPWTHVAVAELKDRLLSEREGLRLREVELERERERSLRRAAELESEFGGVDPELLALCDELDAELLASRYDELEPDQAALVQARLGEISRALVVRDPEAVARQLAGKERVAQNVWLVGPGFGGPTELEVTDGEALVQDGEAIRLTRLPARPTLGRSARARRASELKVEAERLALELEAGVQRSRRLDAYLGELTALIANPQCFAVADPEQLLAEVRSAQASHASETERRQSELAGATRRAAELEARVRELRSALPDALLLDGKDHVAHAAELALELEAARRAKQELAATGDARSVLAGLLDALRSAPRDTDELARLEDERRRSETQRDLAFALCEALTDLLERRAALGWEKSAEALAERADLLPTLEAEQREARRLLDAAEVACRQAESEWEEVTRVWQKAEAEWVTLDAHRAQQALLLEREGADDHSDAALLLADQAVEATRAAHGKSSLDERRLGTEIALLDERRKQLAATFERDAALREESGANAGPATVELAAMQRELAQRGLERLEREAEVAFEDSASALAEARTQRELLLERVSGAQNGGELGEQLRAVFAPERSGGARAHLEAWLAVRAWLARRIPSQIAQGADPLEGLERLRDHLAALERRLGRQEGDLRGASEDIARSVEAQLRRAKNQVRRLQQSLHGLSFGNIAGIRVQMRRVERMDQILKALKEGAAQEFLFQRGLPIEDALNEVFRRYGGGKSGGQRLLDYREYVELEVEIQRRSSETWEPANATRLSTGEAIGVGAALMMVVLTEWERDANLFRGRREHGSLRFLFLDEANRLSHDNLGTLFDLCRTLDLQLLIAAPEVARADGNTTYRLVRTVDSEGREEVIVSGRRTTTEVAQA